MMLILLGVPKRWAIYSELRPIYQGCRALTFALAKFSCFVYVDAATVIQVLLFEM